MIYLDYNATTPVDDLVVAEMMPFLTTHFGNPSSSHEEGQKAAQAIAAARLRVADLIECKSNEIVFMPGATETINYVIKGLGAKMMRNFPEMNHVVTTRVEHVAVLECCAYLERLGMEVTYVPVDKYGRVDPKDVLSAIKPTTFLVSIILANNEVGTLQPIAEIAAEIKLLNRSADRPLLMHTDASQAVGKIPVSVRELGSVDFLTIAGHKLYAPKGIAALFMRDDVCVRPENLIHGGSQEGSIRPGTENVLLDVALGKACEIAKERMDEGVAHSLRLRDLLLSTIQKECDVDFRVNGHPSERLPNTLSISFKNIQVGCLIHKIQAEVGCSAGSACHSVKDAAAPAHVSHVLQAMQVPSEYITGTIRLSVGRYSTEQQVLQAARVISQAANSLEAARSASADTIPSTERLYYKDTHLFSATGTVVALSKGSVKGMEDHGVLDVVVLDQSVFHPQGGGQPSDIGFITSIGDCDVHNATSTNNETATSQFEVLHTRTAESTELDLPAGVIAHFGRVKNGPQMFVGQKVSMVIDEQFRKMNARLHSTGHLIDRAMSMIGYSFLPAKGNHFEDNAFVEYIGKLPADERNTLPLRLNEACAELIAENIGTVVEDVPIGRIQDLCGESCDVSHLDPHKPVRVVNVAGMNCPCGGTHVKNTTEIGSVNVTKVKAKSGRLKVYYTVSKC